MNSWSDLSASVPAAEPFRRLSLLLCDDSAESGPANVVIDDDALETAFKMGRPTRSWPLSGRQRSWADSSNCLVGYLAAACRRLDRSLAVIVQSTPAAGKSAATPS